MGKKIRWEEYKKFKFDHTIKWYMLKQEPIQENDIRQILLDFEIETRHLISSRRPERLKKRLKKRDWGTNR